MNPRLVTMIERGKDRTAMEYAWAALKLEEFSQQIQPFFEKYDLLLTPQTAVPTHPSAYRHGHP